MGTVLITFLVGLIAFGLVLLVAATALLSFVEIRRGYNGTRTPLDAWIRIIDPAERIFITSAESGIVVDDSGHADKFAALASLLNLADVPIRNLYSDAVIPLARWYCSPVTAKWRYDAVNQRLIASNHNYIEVRGVDTRRWHPAGVLYADMDNAFLRIEGGKQCVDIGSLSKFERMTAGAQRILSGSEDSGGTSRIGVSSRTDAFGHCSRLFFESGECAVSVIACFTGGLVGGSQIRDAELNDVVGTAVGVLKFAPLLIRKIRIDGGGRTYSDRRPEHATLNGYTQFLKGIKVLTYLALFIAGVVTCHRRWFAEGAAGTAGWILGIVAIQLSVFLLCVVVLG